MNFNNGWKALLKPGKSKQFFKKNIRFEANINQFNRLDALWLAELCRLIYKKHDKPGKYSKQAILSQNNINEIAFFNVRGTQCALIEIDYLPQPCLILVFRGTDELRDWLVNLDSLPTHCQYGIGLVHKGFQAALNHVWDQVVPYLQTFNGHIFYTGHSLGGALATLSAIRHPPHAVYTYGSPKVGDQKFVSALDAIKIYRIVNNRDIVTTVPPSTSNIDYAHVGELHYITHHNELVVNPSDAFVQQDRDKYDVTLNASTNFSRWFDPPEFLADHAPINYTAHLSR